MPLNKYLVLISSLLLFLCLGINYSWSIFAQELRANHGFSMVMSQTVFSVYQLIFTTAFIFGGRLLDKFGPVVAGITGSVFFGVGFLLAGFLPLTPICLTLSIGVLSGIGIGLAYASPIYAAQKTFPQHTSLATGVTVAGFGFSAVCFTFISEFLLSREWSLSAIFRLYGITFIVIGWLASRGLNVPRQGKEKIAAAGVQSISLLTSRTYWMLVIPMSAGLFAGLMVISNLKTIGLKWGMVPYVAAVGVSVLALFNTLGRVGWGYVAHKWNEETAIRASLIIQTVSFIVAAFFVRTPVLFIIFAAIAGFNYGANLVLYASFVTRIFGVEAFGKVYPLVFFCNALAGFLGPMTGGRIYDVTGSYFWAVMAAGIFCALGLVMFEILRPHNISKSA
jgi:MFS transporter, OFA family, oxalate/formate antiporter